MPGISYIRMYSIFIPLRPFNRIHEWHFGLFCSSTITINNDTWNAWSKSYWHAYSGSKHQQVYEKTDNFLNFNDFSNCTECAHAHLEIVYMKKKKHSKLIARTNILSLSLSVSPSLFSLHYVLSIFPLVCPLFCCCCRFAKSRKHLHRPGSQSPPLPPPPPEDDDNQNFGRPRTQSVGPLAPIVPDDQNLPGWVPKNYIEKVLFTFVLSKLLVHFPWKKRPHVPAVKLFLLVWYSFAFILGVHQRERQISVKNVVWCKRASHQQTPATPSSDEVSFS